MSPLRDGPWQRREWTAGRQLAWQSPAAPTPPQGGPNFFQLKYDFLLHRRCSGGGQHSAPLPTILPHGVLHRSRGLRQGPAAGNTVEAGIVSSFPNIAITYVPLDFNMILAVIFWPILHFRASAKKIPGDGSEVAFR